MNNLLALHPLPWSVLPNAPETRANCFECLRVADANGQTVQRITDCGHAQATPEALEKAFLFAATPSMLKALERLLDCPDLNLDELEPETRAAIDEAENVIDEAQETDIAAQILGSADPRA